MRMTESCYETLRVLKENGPLKGLEIQRLSGEFTKIRTASCYIDLFKLIDNKMVEVISENELGQPTYQVTDYGIQTIKSELKRRSFISLL